MSARKSLDSSVPCARAKEGMASKFCSRQNFLTDVKDGLETAAAAATDMLAGIWFAGR